MYNSHIDHFNRQEIAGPQVLFGYMEKARTQNLVKWLVCSHVVASLQVFTGDSNESFIPCHQLMILFFFFFWGGEQNRREKHSFPALACKCGGTWPHTFWVTRHRQLVPWAVYRQPGSVSSVVSKAQIDNCSFHHRHLTP